jgi:peroxiredoxin
MLSAAFLTLALAAGEPGKPEVGKPAPDFDAPAVNVDTALPAKRDTKRLALKDLKGKNVVLFFFPKAMTRG